MGLNHVVEVLTGAETEKIRKWNHHELSTYNIGREHSRPEWQMIGRELVRLGYLRQTAEKFSVLELTKEGREMLRDRKKVTLTRPVTTLSPKEKVPRAGEIACDETLFDRLRDLRRKLADERNVPAYIVFSDVALRQMARLYPSNDEEFSRISGVGEKKLREFGVVFLEAIASYLQTYPRQMFADDSFSSPAPKGRMNDTARETAVLFRSGYSVEEIAKKRSLTHGTIFSHLETAIAAGEALDLSSILGKEQSQQITAAFSKFGFANLTGVKEVLGDSFSYEQIRLCRAILQRSG